MPQQKINNTNYYYELHGSGEPVILIAGYTCDHLAWQAVTEGLSKQFQVLVFDNRAIGQTTDNNEPLSAELMAQEVIALADALHLKRPNIIGQSMGGTIAQAIASNFPEKINKLAILNSTAKWRQAMLRGLHSHLLMIEQAVPFDVLFESIIPWVFGEDFLQSTTKVNEFKNALIENPNPQSLANQKRQFQVLQKFNGLDQLSKITADTAIICGAQDIISLPFESEYLAKKISNAKLVTLNSAHAPMVEMPNDLNDVLLSFLNS